MIPPAIEVPMSGSILPDGNNLIFPFRAVNLAAVDVEVVKIYSDNVLHYLQDNEIEDDVDSTQEEIDYIRNDVEIMARAMKFMFNEGLNKMTIGSDALHYYKKINKNFSMYFPQLPYEIDMDVRKSYKGGFTYLNDIYKEKETGKGLVLDVNSLYPSVMVNEKLPFGDEEPQTEPEEPVRTHHHRFGQ